MNVLGEMTLERAHDPQLAGIPNHLEGCPQRGELALSFPNMSHFIYEILAAAIAEHRAGEV